MEKKKTLCNHYQNFFANRPLYCPTCNNFLCYELCGDKHEHKDLQTFTKFISELREKQNLKVKDLKYELKSLNSYLEYLQDEKSLFSDMEKCISTVQKSLEKMQEEYKQMVQNSNTHSKLINEFYNKSAERIKSEIFTKTTDSIKINIDTESLIKSNDYKTLLSIMQMIRENPVYENEESKEIIKFRNRKEKICEEFELVSAKMNQVFMDFKEMHSEFLDICNKIPDITSNISETKTKKFGNEIYYSLYCDCLQVYFPAIEAIREFKIQETKEIMNLSSVNIKNHILISGGDIYPEYLKTTYLIEIIPTFHITQKADMLIGKNRHCLAEVLGKYVYSIGGYNPEKHELKECEKYYVESNKWVFAPCLQYPLIFSSYCKINETLIITIPGNYYEFKRPIQILDVMDEEKGWSCMSVSIETTKSSFNGVQVNSNEIILFDTSTLDLNKFEFKDNFLNWKRKLTSLKVCKAILPYMYKGCIIELIDNGIAAYNINTNKYYEKIFHIIPY